MKSLQPTKLISLVLLFTLLWSSILPYSTVYAEDATISIDSSSNSSNSSSQSIDAPEPAPSSQNTLPITPTEIDIIQTPSPDQNAPLPVSNEQTYESLTNDTGSLADSASTPLANTNNTNISPAAVDTTNSNTASDTQDSPLNEDEGTIATSIASSTSTQEPTSETIPPQITLHDSSALLNTPESPQAAQPNESADISTSIENDQVNSDVSTPNDLDTPPVIVESGEAVAMANILNILNTNFINSDGVILFSNYFDYVEGDIDFSSYLSPDNNTCVTLGCATGKDLEVNTVNTAFLQNTISLDASTGNNTVENASSAEIHSGDAYAGLNLINVANSNIVDSEYLIVTLNAFRGIGGDIVFPSLNQFFNSLNQSNSNDITTINELHDADVTNTVDSTASTGENNISNSTGGSITSGNSTVKTNVFNKLNTTIQDGDSISIIVRVDGDWAGDVFGAPESLSWTRNPDGSLFIFDKPLPNRNLAADQTNTTINADNITTIDNNITIAALTGENHINNAETALITTGNAVAGANIVNIANTSVVGRNWILAIINVFGDFKGNIAFGRPDLWIGEQISAPEVVTNDTEVTYTYSIINNGDSVATQSVLHDDYDEQHISIIDSNTPYTLTDQGIKWELPNLQPGAALTVSYRGHVIQSSPGDEINNTATISAHETDANISDNSDSAKLVVSFPTVESSTSSTTNNSQTYTNDESPEPQEPPQQILDLDIIRPTSEIILFSADEDAHQKLVVKNPSNQDIHNVVVTDSLIDPYGQTVHHEPWNLGTVLAHEEIMLEYVIDFKTDSPVGTYRLITSTKGESLYPLETINGSVVILPNEVGPSITEHGNTQPLSPVAAPYSNSNLLGILETKEAYADTNPDYINALPATVIEPHPLSPTIGLYMFVCLTLGYSLYKLCEYYAKRNGE